MFCCLLFIQIQFYNRCLLFVDAQQWNRWERGLILSFDNLKTMLSGGCLAAFRAVGFTIVG